ncbi:MAG: fumarate reductase subunit C [Gammaproteobacteria bacterium]|nr:MAG: fumarate reductase subunit C [Gammaproteobacteria bacterium]
MRKPYQPKQPRNWWLKHPAYRFYMLREATALPLMLYTLLLICGIFALGRGEAAFGDWVAALRSPWFVLFHLVVGAALLLHIVSWFALVPKILVLRARGFEVPGGLLKAAHWGGAITCTVLIVVAFMFFGGVWA